MIERLFYWVGAVLCVGTIVLVAGGVWYAAISLVLRSLNETWWIATWAIYKRDKGGSYAAKRVLSKAIRADETADEKKAKAIGEDK